MKSTISYDVAGLYPLYLPYETDKDSTPNPAKMQFMMPVIKRGETVCLPTSPDWENGNLLSFEGEFYPVEGLSLKEGEGVWLMGEKFVNDARFVAASGNFPFSTQNWDRLPDGHFYTVGTYQDFITLSLGISQMVFTSSRSLLTSDIPFAGRFAYQAMDLYLRFELPWQQVVTYQQSVVLTALGYEEELAILTERIDKSGFSKPETDNTGYHRSWDS